MNRVKKIVSFSIVFAALTARVLAQELTFNGYLNSGIGVINSDAKDADTIVKAYAVDAWQNAYRIRLNGAYTNADKTAGVNFRFQTQAKQGLAVQSGIDVYAFSIPYFYGWVQFLNGIFTASGGLVDDGTWAAGDYWIIDDAGEGIGVQLRAKPLKELELGVGAYLASQLGSGDNNALAITDFSKLALKAGDVKYVYSGSFTLPNVFRAGASFRWKNKAGHNGTDIANGYVYDGRQESSALLGDIRLLAVKNLTALAAFSFDKIEDFDAVGNIIFSETFAYKADALNIGLNAVQFLYNRRVNNEKVDYDPGLLFNLWGSYAIDRVVPRLDLAYFTGGQSNTANAKLAYDRHGYTDKPGVKDNDDDYTTIGIRPSVKFNFNSNTFIELGDVINIDTVNFDAGSPYADSDDAGKKNRITNVFYIDLKWSF
jgi:hypothetical protein